MEKPASSIRNYNNTLNKTSSYPRDPYEHGAFLIEGEDKQEVENALGKFSKLVNKRVLLSNISNDQLMRLCQNDIILLTHLFDCAVREEELAPVFKVLYYGWVNELSLTRTKNGAERKHQAQIGTSYTPSEQLYGYGKEMNFAGEEEEEGNIFSKIFKKKK